MQRSQAALEFLTTYAWAIAVIVVGVAIVLAYGIFNSRSSLPNTVINGFSGAIVKEAVANSTTLEFTVSDSLAEKINIISIYVASNGANLTSFSCLNYTLYTGQQTPCSVPGSFNGNSNSVSIVYTYYNGAFNERDVSIGSILTNPVTGKIKYNPNP